MSETGIAERKPNTVARREDNPGRTLQALLESRRAAIAAVLPKHLDPDRLLKIALVAVSKNELLMKCSQSTILQSVMTAAQLGLDCGGALGSSYLVPFYISEKGVYECQLVLGYRGLIDLARRSGQIVSIEARIVYQNDTFDLDYSIDGAKLTHKPCLDGEPGPMRLVYGVATLKDGGHQFEIMTKAQVEKIRMISQTGKKNKGPWSNHYDEMARKTVVKRLAKYLPISVELSDAIDNDNRAEGFDPTAFTVTQDETAKLNDKLKLAKQNSAGALPDPVDVTPIREREPEPEPDPDAEPGEIPNDHAAPGGSEPAKPSEPVEPKQQAADGAREAAAAQAEEHEEQATEIAATLNGFQEFYETRAVFAGVASDEAGKLFFALKSDRALKKEGALSRLSPRVEIAKLILVNAWDFKTGRPK